MLTVERLLRFDLVEELETSLMKPAGSPRLMDFFGTYQEILSVNQFIKELPSAPGSTDKIIRSELLSAIGATLAIEGTALAKEEIEASFEKAELNQSLARKEQEAENSRKVYEFVINVVSDHEGPFKYSEQVIRQIHKYFTDNMNYLGNEPGQYRGDFRATFGHPRRSGLCRTRGEVEEAMTRFVEWLNTKEISLLSSNIVVKAIMAHYYLTEIHPFSDGNGRTARALEALVLFVSEMNNYCFWSLANFWSMHRDEYIIHLGNIRNTSDPWDFLIWGMKGYLEELKRIKNLVLTKVKQLMLLDYTNYLLKTKQTKTNSKGQRIRVNQRIVDVLGLLIRSGRKPLAEFQSSPEFRALYSNRKPATKSRDFAKMVGFGLIWLSEQRDDKKVMFIEPNYRILDTLVYRV